MAEMAEIYRYYILNECVFVDEQQILVELKKNGVLL